MRGEGSWLVDDKGKRYLDFVQGWTVNALGHCHRAIVEALSTQAALLAREEFCCFFAGDQGGTLILATVLYLARRPALRR